MPTVFVVFYRNMTEASAAIVPRAVSRIGGLPSVFQEDTGECSRDLLDRCLLWNEHHLRQAPAAVAEGVLQAALPRTATGGGGCPSHQRDRARLAGRNVSRRGPRRRAPQGG
ncbi:hypothetical protein OIE67_50925 [Nonomuraea fuscirosea]|uniref:hypothetical protein n=1 Tax=Nonomuraea fuscirosea TaxID=1291556 RepID=UPI002DD84EB3|nr:hypothetical protein [Nonomuraea fuscirosea]WSA52262.1 hypothetical protein OIE67_50925 [Nonomuraea fuscirosea]